MLFVFAIIAAIFALCDMPYCMLISLWLAFVCGLMLLGDARQNMTRY